MIDAATDDDDGNPPMWFNNCTLRKALMGSRN
jgi:hypothetical protein